jgi:hypothetical protein
MPKPPLFYCKTGTLEPEFVSRDVARKVLLDAGYKRQDQFWVDAKSCTHLEFYTLREAWADFCNQKMLDRAKIMVLLGLEETAERAISLILRVIKAGG